MRWMLSVAMMAAGCAAVFAETAEGTEEPAVVEVVHTPPATGSPAYSGNRRPLAGSPLIKLPIGSIRPEGWLRTQLELMRDGFVGHLAEVSRFPREGSGWLDPSQEGWEEVPYWLKGFGDLGYVLGDERIINEAKRWIDAMLASQDEEGYFGPRLAKERHDYWSNMVMLYVLRSRYEATGDERVLPAMTKYFRYRHALPEESLYPHPWGEGPYRKEWWQHVRAGDELDSVYWLYNRTGEAWLLELAEKIQRRWARWDLGIQSWHGVNICQGFRNPAIAYQQTKDEALLAAALRNHGTVYAQFGQAPGGMFGADENCRPGYTDPRQAAETCSMVEMMHSLEMLLKITGRPGFADQCEDIAFNSLPASMTPDLRGLHYLTAPNMVQLDRASKAPGLENGGTMLAFSPWRYRCCQHNVAFGWPYFAEHLWMATQDGGVAAVLYAPCELTATVRDGREVRIEQRTDYPFREAMELTIHAAEPVEFPLYLRVPGWCRRPEVAINGAGQPVSERGAGADEAARFVRLERAWQNGDRVMLRLPMEVRVRRWERQHDAVSVHRGPLAYSLRIEERWEPYADAPEGVALAADAAERWPGYEVFPASPWNYGLVLDEGGDHGMRVAQAEGDLPEQPFVLDGSPVTLRARARRIDGWQLDRTGLIGPLQASPARVPPGEPEEITLVPMGCARLRVTMFPTVSTAEEAQVWTPPPRVPHEASYEYDDIAALSDGVWPSNSGDHSVPRFTWWDHKGTMEWVTFRFEAPQRVRETHVYWFDDTGVGQCRVPLAWRLLYRAGDGWQQVTNPTGGGVAKDKFNTLTFDEVETTELKLEVTLQQGFSGGILEWVVGPLGPR